jgi:hypothetical protein
MEVKWYADEFFKTFDAVTDDLLNMIGGQCVTWAARELDRFGYAPLTVPTSNLTNSIAYATQKQQSEMRGKTDGQKLSPADKDSVNFGSNVVYAARYELGFTGTDSLGRSYNQAPRPFLRNVMANHKNDIMQIINGVYGK